jgi:putative copper resistance protein D
MPVGQPLTWSTVLTSWQFSSWDVLVAVLAVAYFAGVLRCRRLGQRWPLWRAGCFTAGLALLVLALNSALGVYSGTLYSVHMVQHLTLIMGVPVLLAFGHPLSLWVVAAPPERRPRRERLLLSWPVTVLTHPALAFVFYSAVLIGTHLTPFLQARLEHPQLGHVEIALYLLSGYALFLPVIGGEPVRWGRLPYVLRVVLLFGAMLPDTLVGVVTMMASQPIAPGFAQAHPGWGPSLLDDQRTAGAIMWLVGDMVMAALSAVVIGMAMRDGGAEAGLGSWVESARRNSLTRAAGPEASPLGADAADADSDEALAAYNAMLARLHGRSSQRSGERGRDPG